MAKRFHNEGNFDIDFAAHFAVAKRAYSAAKWHSCAKGWFRSCETPFEMAHRLRNGGSPSVEISQLRNGCTWLRNGTCVPRGFFAAAKIFAKGARRLQNGFTVEIGFRNEERDFRSGSLGLRIFFSTRGDFRSGVL